MTGKTLIVSHVPILPSPLEPVTVHFKSIQEAINKAEDSDTILVKAGTYSENISISDKSLTIMGERGVGTVTIDGSNLGNTKPGFLIKRVHKAPIITIENVTIENFTNNKVSGQTYIGNGEGGGIYVSPKVTLTAKNCVIRDNNSSDGGAGIFIFAVALSNEADITVMTVDHCQITGNVSGGYGGGILNQGISTIIYCTIKKNHAGGTGGGIQTMGHNSKITIKNSVISENSADNSGNITPCVDNCP